MRDYQILVGYVFSFRYLLGEANIRRMRTLPRTEYASGECDLGLKWKKIVKLLARYIKLYLFNKIWQVPEYLNLLEEAVILIGCMKSPVNNRK